MVILNIIFIYLFMNLHVCDTLLIISPTEISLSTLGAFVHLVEFENDEFESLLEVCHRTCTLCNTILLELAIMIWSGAMIIKKDAVKF